MLAEALDLIEPQTVVWYEFSGNATLPNGIKSPSFAPGIALGDCSVQPVKRSRYESYGLDVQKNYVTWYASADLKDLERASTGDQMEWAGRRWQLISEMDWFHMDGWTSVICVEIGKVGP